MFLPHGPASVQQLQNEVNELREELRRCKLQNSPTVQVEETGANTLLHVVPPEPASTDVRMVWL